MSATVRDPYGVLGVDKDASDDGYRASFTYVDQFMDDTFGVAFGIAYADTPTQSERFNAWGYPSANPGDPWGSTAVDGAYVIGVGQPIELGLDLSSRRTNQLVLFHDLEPLGRPPG